jgi:hypothetical protein
MAQARPREAGDVAESPTWRFAGGTGGDGAVHGARAQSVRRALATGVNAAVGNFQHRLDRQA